MAETNLAPSRTRGGVKRPFRHLGATAVAAVLLAACAPAGPRPAPAPVAPDYTPADVAFMSDMIAHHAQAVLIAGWAPARGAGPAVLALCERTVVGQQDEITLMQQWLRERGQPVPDGASPHDAMGGTHHAGSMPGMLTPDELAQLGRARGTEFDRLFLTLMIRHHQGALTMVDQLFTSQGGGEQTRVFRIASDIYADQTAEIARMQQLAAALTPEGRKP